MNDQANRTSASDGCSKVRILKQNTTYRVADLFFREGIRWQRDRETILHSPEYRNTLLHDYLTTRDGEEDYEAFKAAVTEHTRRKQYPVPEPNDLVFHMRLGDVMEMPERFNKAIAKYSRIYDKIDRKVHPVSRAVVVTALHFGANNLNDKYFYSPLAEKKSFEVLRLLETRTNEFGLPLSIVSNDDVDADLCFMAASKYFVKSLSRFSDIVARCLPTDARVFEL